MQGKVEAVGYYTMKPDMHNVAAPLGSDWETSSETVTPNTMYSSLLPFNYSQKIWWNDCIVTHQETNYDHPSNKQDISTGIL